MISPRTLHACSMAAVLWMFVSYLAVKLTAVQSQSIRTVNCSSSNFFTVALSTSTNLTLEIRTGSPHGQKECQWVSTVPSGHHFSVTIDKLKTDPGGDFTLTIWEVVGKYSSSPVTVKSTALKSTAASFIFFSPVQVRFQSQAPGEPLTLSLHHIVRKGSTVRDLPVVKVSDTVSYVTSPGYRYQLYPNDCDAVVEVDVSNNESVVVSVREAFIEHSHECYKDYLQIDEVAESAPWNICGNPVTSVTVYRSSLRLHFRTDTSSEHYGFKVMFAVLPKSQEPELLPANVFNCSVPHFSRFEPLLRCNMIRECEGGEDEENCWYHSRECGHDLIDGYTKCYRLVRPNNALTWNDAKYDCIRHGQKLVTFGTVEEYQQFRTIFYHAKNMRDVYVGAQTVSRLEAVSVAALYKYIWQWVDERTAFSVQMYGYQYPPSCSFYDSLYGILRPTLCYKEKMADFVCEVDKPVLNKHADAATNKNISVMIDAKSVIWNVSVVQCPSGHMTRDFLSCDPQADCDVLEHMTSCAAGGVVTPMFSCRRSQTALHYSLVCDYVQHCPDNSDEDFCQHPRCDLASAFMECRNGQCIRDNQLCDGSLDCYDGSDEACQTSRGFVPYELLQNQPPGTVHFDGKGKYRVDPVNGSRQCPSTHFMCPQDFCLPVYLRCNGIEDCPGREDEAGCDIYTCPGFYRCRGSKVCLHADNVCDGVPQCPEQDDELLCDLSCPDQCHCQGLAFVCSTSFSASSYPALRYLDASGSGMTPGDFTDNLYLIHLRLSNCGISNVSLMVGLPNLQVLDLSWNRITSLDMQQLSRLKNLRVLVLRGNPLVKITDSVSSNLRQTQLENIDLSYTSLEVLNGSAFMHNPDVTALNISLSKLKTITKEGFRFTPKLKNLDSRGSSLQMFPRDLLNNLAFLENVYADNYKLCCQAMLPEDFNSKNCHSEQDLLSSCQTLLKSTTYRVFVWSFASLSLVGNVGSFVTMFYLKAKGEAIDSFSVFVANLAISDFFMGVYLTIVGAADLIYHGEYLWYDDEWMNSTACKVAGFLALLSSEVSAIMICLITLDRVLVLRFPLSRLHFRFGSALITCGVVWFVGIILTAVPLVPMASHWEFYSQSGICIPLPFTSREGFHGYDYFFSLVILLNLVLFLLVAFGLADVFWSLRSKSMPPSTSSKAKAATITRRLTTIIMSDLFCWLPIGLLGVLAATGTSVSGELNVAVAIFVLPVNSALNPFLYIFNVLMEKRDKAQETRLLYRLESHMRHKPSTTQN